MTEHVDHGNTVAAWTGVTLITAGFLVGAIGLITGGVGPLFWTGVGLGPVGLVVGKVLALMGYGKAS
jgi:hypothetical protein